MNALFVIVFHHALNRLDTPRHAEAVNALHCLDLYIANPEYDNALHRAAQRLWGSSPPKGVLVSNHWRYTIDPSF